MLFLEPRQCGNYVFDLDHFPVFRFLQNLETQTQRPNWIVGTVTEASLGARQETSL